LVVGPDQLPPRALVGTKISRALVQRS